MRAVHASHCDDDPHEGQTEDNRRSQGCPAQSERPPDCVVAAALGVWSGVWHRVHFDHRHPTRRRRRCHEPTHIPDATTTPTIERTREAMLPPLLVTVKQSDPFANRVMYRLRYVHEVR